MKLKVLDLGCGKNKITMQDSIVIGVDISSDSKADVIHDLNVFPYPFMDNEFDIIRCFDVLEHLEDITRVLDELHRTSKNRALILIRVPHFSSSYSYMDPTHLRGFSYFSFDHFCYNKKIIPHNIDKRLFYLKKRNIVFPKIKRILFFWGCWIANNFPLRYEQHFAFVFQAENIYLELKTIK